MNRHYVTKVAELHVSLCKKIKDCFNSETTIEFNEPFVIYQAVWDGDSEIGMIKVPFVCKTLRAGEFLEGDDGYGVAFEAITMVDVEDILSVAHVLDIATEGKYKIIDYA